MKNQKEARLIAVLKKWSEFMQENYTDKDISWYRETLEVLAEHEEIPELPPADLLSTLGGNSPAYMAPPLGFGIGLDDTDINESIEDLDASVADDKNNPE